MANKFKVDLANAFTNWNDDVGGWASSSGGVGIVSHPVAGDAATADGNSGNIVVNVSSACSSFTATGAYAGTMSGSAPMNLTGTGTVWSWGTGTLTYSGTITISDSSASDKTFAGGGKTYGALVIAPGDGFVSLQGANTYSSVVTAAATTQLGGGSHTVTGTLTLTQGDLLFSSDITLGGFSSSNTNVRSLAMADATVVLTGTGTVWNLTVATNFTAADFGGSTIIISDTSSAGKTFAGGGQTYNEVFVTTGAGVVTVTGNNTFAAWQCHGAPCTFTGNNSFGGFGSGGALIFTGTTTTFTDESPDLTGCPSLTGGNWVKTSGTVTAPSGCVITNNHASGGATFTATSAINGGGNTGWTFTHPQPTAGEDGIMARWWQFGRHVSRFARRIR